MGRGRRRRAASSIRPAGTPVADPRPTPACSRRAAARARPSRPCGRATKSSSTRPSRAITWRRAKASAASLPGKGWRWRSAASAVGVRTGSTTITRAGASGSQWSWACGAEADGFAPQTRMQAESRAVAGRNRRSGGAVHVLERDVPGLVADRVRVDLGSAEAVEEAQREEVGEQRERAGVVGVQERVRTCGRDDFLETAGDRRERLVPRHGLEAALALRADAPERSRQARLGVEEGAVVADRALAAELAPTHRVIRVAPHVPDRPVPLDDRDPARVVAVPRTRRQHHFVHARRHNVRSTTPRRACEGISPGIRTYVLYSRKTWLARSTSKTRASRL